MKGGPLLASCLCGLAASIGTAKVVERGELAEAGLRARELAGTLQAHLTSPLETLQALKSLMEMPKSGPSHSQFQHFAQAARQRQPYIVALEWFPLVNKEQRPLFEAYVRREQPYFAIREPSPAGNMTLARRRQTHLPLTYCEPELAAIHGLDLSFDPQRVAPATKALSTKQLTLSDRYSLVEDPDDVFSLVAYAPVEQAAWVHEPDAAGGAYRRGVVVTLFRIGELLKRALKETGHHRLFIELTDPGAAPEARLLHRSSGRHAEHVSTLPLVVADRRYELRVFTQQRTLPWMAWGTGLGTFCAIFTAALWIEARKRARALERTLRRLGVYRLVGKIAEGGMGTVYRAEHALLKRPTAIKISHDPEHASYFEKEAKLTSALTHPNTVLLYDYGKGQNGAFYFAMEFIEGYDLQQLVDLHGALPQGRAVRLMIQVAGSLGEAHQRAIIHRDIKPSNIMITERGCMKDFVKVLDFGLAKQHADVAGIQTQRSANRIRLSGTPGYLAPELIAGSAATPRSDIFSFGAVLYFLVSARPPFPGATLTEILTRALGETAAPLPANVHPELAQLIQRCMERDPTQRPENMQAVSSELRRILALLVPFDQEQIEAWWRQNPPQLTLTPTHESLTFVLKNRSSARSVPGSEREI